MEAEGKKYVPAPGQEVVVRMVKELKRPGRAAGGGFYEYPKEGKKFLWPELADALVKKYGERFTPPKLPRDLAAKGGMLA